jgi:[ribosomal protein S5]-alanine N-acetyltransferase
MPYMVHRPFWKQGIATETAMACREYALDVLGRPRVVSLIRPANHPFLKVADRLGMRRIGETIHAGLPHDLYAYARAGGASGGRGEDRI